MANRKKVWEQHLRHMDIHSPLCVILSFSAICPVGLWLTCEAFVTLSIIKGCQVHSLLLTYSAIFQTFVLLSLLDKRLHLCQLTVKCYHRLFYFFLTSIHFCSRLYLKVQFVTFIHLLLTAVLSCSGVAGVLECIPAIQAGIPGMGT